ncbi:hypothetical protein Aduo_018332 [Ancylostoma duodenale]
MFLRSRCIPRHLFPPLRRRPRSLTAPRQLGSRPAATLRRPITPSPLPPCSALCSTTKASIAPDVHKSLLLAFATLSRHHNTALRDEISSETGLESARTLLLKIALRNGIHTLGKHTKREKNIQTHWILDRFTIIIGTRTPNTHNFDKLSTTDK